MKRVILIMGLIILSFNLISCQDEQIEEGEIQESLSNPEAIDETDPSPSETQCLKTLHFDQLQPVFFQRNCKKASPSQIRQVNRGNMKRDEFLANCYRETRGSCWCDQLVRPNPSSIDLFRCTYGEEQVHQLIHPDESTWKYAFEAVKIVEEFAAQNLTTEIIYNWWRPEPYNKNVSGSPSRHPLGTSVDVRFMSKEIQNKAFTELCKMRAKGRIRAIGYYSSTAIHFGIGDSRANTWGKRCP